MADFQTVQRTFTAHIRQPDFEPMPNDVELRRMKIYSELFYNNVEGLLANAYPVVKQVLGNEQWHQLIRDYFAQHRAHTPLFPQVPQEFLQYLHEEREPQADDPVFLGELAHYEWAELAVAIDTREIDLTNIDINGNLLDAIPVLNPLAMPLAYQFPVHEICPDYQPDTPPEQPTYLIVYRNSRDKVGFVHLNPVSARLLALLQTESAPTGRVALETIAKELQHPQPETVIQGGLEILQAWREREIVLGCISSSSV